MGSMCTIQTQKQTYATAHIFLIFFILASFSLFHIIIYTYYKSTQLDIKQCYNTPLIFKKILKPL